MDKELDWGALFAVYEGHHLDTHHDDPNEVARTLAILADGAPDDDHLHALAISLIESFLGVQEQDAFPAFENAMRSSARLRRAWCYAWSAVPEEWEARFNALVQEGERPPR